MHAEITLWLCAHIFWTCYRLIAFLSFSFCFRRPLISQNVHYDVVVVLSIDKAGIPSSSNFLEADFQITFLCTCIEVECFKFNSVEVQVFESKAKHQVHGFLSVAFAPVFWVVYAYSYFSGSAGPVDIKKTYSTYEVVVCRGFDCQRELFSFLALFPCIPYPFFFVIATKRPLSAFPTRFLSSMLFQYFMISSRSESSKLRKRTLLPSIISTNQKTVDTLLYIKIEVVQYKTNDVLLMYAPNL